jgi:hypothetical protein
VPSGYVLGLILLGLQLIVAWFAAPVIVRYIPRLGRLELFVYAAVFAVLVWLVGVIGAQSSRTPLRPPVARSPAH